MNLPELEKKLIAAARRTPPDERVPYAFEKRIMSLIAERTGADQWVFWAQGLWRTAIPCVALAVVICAALSFSSGLSDNGSDLSQDFENTLLASVDLPDNPTP